MLKVDYNAALRIAQSQLSLNVREIQENWGNPDIQKYLKNAGIDHPAAWCAAFLEWCFDQAGGCPWDGIKYTAYVPCITDWAKENGIYKPKHDALPKGGDLIIFGNQAGPQHIGMVEKLNGPIINTIEGNTSAPGGGPEGLYRKQHQIAGSWVQGIIQWPIAAATGYSPEVTIRVDGKAIAGGEVHEGVTWAPVGAVAKALGAAVAWDAKTKTVLITKQP